MDAPMGRLVYLPAGVAGPDPDAFLSDVLTGWRRAQLAQNFSPDTARRRVASVLRMGDFVGCCAASSVTVGGQNRDGVVGPSWPFVSIVQGVRRFAGRVCSHGLRGGNSLFDSCRRVVRQLVRRTSDPIHGQGF